jgi:mRNA interferase RelE/StbE
MNYSGDWKRLTGSRFWRLRVGQYRAICDMRDDELVLLVIEASGPST